MGGSHRNKRALPTDQSVSNNDVWSRILARARARTAVAKALPPSLSPVPVPLSPSTVLPPPLSPLPPLLSPLPLSPSPLPPPSASLISRGKRRSTPPASDGGVPSSVVGLLQRYVRTADRASFARTLTGGAFEQSADTLGQLVRLMGWLVAPLPPPSSQHRPAEPAGTVLKAPTSTAVTNEVPFSARLPFIDELLAQYPQVGNYGCPCRAECVAVFGRAHLQCRPLLAAVLTRSSALVIHLMQHPQIRTAGPGQIALPEAVLRACTAQRHVVPTGKILYAMSRMGWPPVYELPASTLAADATFPSLSREQRHQLQYRWSLLAATTTVLHERFTTPPSAPDSDDDFGLDDSGDTG